MSNNLNTAQFAYYQQNVQHLLLLLFFSACLHGREKNLKRFFFPFRYLIAKLFYFIFFSFLFKMHNNCSFVFFYCADCFSGIAGALLISSFCNHGKLWPAISSECLTKESAVESRRKSQVSYFTNLSPNERKKKKIVKTYSSKTKVVF